MTSNEDDMTTPPVVLTVGGSDSLAGSGIQADLKTFGALGCYGANVITAVISRNTVDLKDVYALPATVVGLQLAGLLSDLPVSAVKIGLLASAEISATVTARARDGGLPNLVLDPVLTTGKGRRAGVRSSMERLFAFATVITPSIEEASALVGWTVSTPADMAGAAAQLAAHGAKCVVVTGGQLGGDEAIDAVWTSRGTKFLKAPRIQTRNTEGTGATFSAAIAARLAKGYPLEDSIDFAKRYVRATLIAAREWKLGSGPGPVNHFVSAP
jgi:hydroxymethylpyrimidine/phosphomethylpyrimidine kinase